MAVGGETHVLIVAGSDSSGGAGIARDIETVAAFGLKSCLAITAVTAQTHERAWAVQPMDADFVAGQMRAAFKANNVKAIKIGMLAEAAIVEAVATVHADYPDIPIVLDPVLASSSGTQLLTEDGIRVVIDRLIPACAIVTPNLPELAILSGTDAKSEAEITTACTCLIDRGARAVLAKGGHRSGEMAIDLLCRPGHPSHTFTSKRAAKNIRGTGCMLSSGIAASLANEESLETAISRAKDLLGAMFLKVSL